MAALMLVGVAETGTTVPTSISTLPGMTSTLSQPTSSTAAEVASVVGTWGLVSITVDGEPMALAPELERFEEDPGVAAWIRFDSDGVVDGDLPCNDFKGEYEQRGSVVEWEIVKTAGYCLELEDGVEVSPWMEAEAPITDLKWTPIVDVEIDEQEEMLVLTGSDVVMTFSRLAD